MKLKDHIKIYLTRIPGIVKEEHPYLLTVENIETLERKDTWVALQDGSNHLPIDAALVRATEVIRNCACDLEDIDIRAFPFSLARKGKEQIVAKLLYDEVKLLAKKEEEKSK